MDSGRDIHIFLFLFFFPLYKTIFTCITPTNYTFTPDNTLLHTRILRSRQRTVKSGSYDLKELTEVDRNGASRRYGMQA